MKSRHNKLLIYKILPLLLVLVVGLTVFGCAGGSIPQGWSGVKEADGTLFLASMDGEVLAIDASNGARLWSQKLEKSGQGGGFTCAPTSTSVAIYGTPAVSGDLVYIGGYDGKIYAFNSSSGALRWVYPREEFFDEPIVGGILAALGKVFFGGSDGKVFALDAATGDFQWEFQTGGKIWATPVLDGDTLYIASFDKKLYALDANNGSKKWETLEAEGAIATTPLVYEGTVYIGSLDRYLYAINAANGSMRWKSTFQAGSWFWTEPIVYNNVIYAGNLDGKIYAVDATTGDKINEFDLDSPISSSPVLVDNSIIIVSEEGAVYALDVSSNQAPRLLTALDEETFAPLSASNEVVYLHAQKNDTIYALNAHTGATLWSLPLSNK